MGKFEGKIAIVTGASAGIGKCIAKALMANGMTVVGLARRKEKIEDLAKELKDSPGKLHALRADMRNEEDILRAFQWVKDNLGTVDVLVNNAGGGVYKNLLDEDADPKEWKSVIDTNLLGVAIASREAIKLMSAANIAGHIININSTSGHKVVNVPCLNIYPASKFALTALTETFRQELIRSGSKIKVTNLSPGLVKTEAFDSAGSTFDDFLKIMGCEKALIGEDIANAVQYIISTPSHVQITELTIQPLGQIES